MTTEYRFMGSHADEVAVGDKRVPVAPGDFVILDDSDLGGDNQRFFDENLLVDVTKLDTKDTPSTVPDKTTTTTAVKPATEENQ